MVNDQPIAPAFPDCNMKYQKLRPLLLPYSKRDLAVAAFCINSWSSNRSAQSTALALNAVVSDADGEADLSISTYLEFRSFCEIVLATCPITVLDDYVYPCFGEEALFRKGRYYRLILGCGAEGEYAALPFLEEFAKVAGKESNLDALLEYIDSIVGALATSNANEETKGEVTLETPPESYWLAVRGFFQEGRFTLPGAALSDRFTDDAAPVERRHFTRCGTDVLPLFNPSLLLDYEELIAEGIGYGPTAARAIRTALIGVAADIYWLPGSDEQLLFPYPTLFADGDEIDLPAAFALAQNDCALVFLDCPNREGDDVVPEVERFLNAQSGMIVSTKQDERGQKSFLHVVDNPSRVQFVAYDHHCSPMREYFAVRGKHDALPRCSALDLCAMLQFADSIGQIHRFFRDWKEGRNYKLVSYSGMAAYFIMWAASDEMPIPGAEDRHGLTKVFCMPGEVDAHYYELFSESYSSFPFGNSSFAVGSPFAWNIEPGEKGFIRAVRKGVPTATMSIRQLNTGADAPRIILSNDIRRSFAPDQNSLHDDGTVWRLLEDMIETLSVELGDEFSCFVDSIGGILQLEYVSEEWADSQATFHEHESLPFMTWVSEESPYGFVRYTARRSLLLESLPECKDRGFETRLFNTVVEQVSRQFGVDVTALKAKIEGKRTENKKVDATEISVPYHFKPFMQLAVPPSVKAKVDKEIAYLCDEAGLMPGDYSGTPANKTIRRMQAALEPSFAKLVESYDMMSIHTAAAEHCACLEHMAYTNKKRATSFNDMDQTVAEKIHQTAAVARRDLRDDIQAIRYLIESNLVMQREGRKSCTKDDLRLLVAYANRLAAISTAADIFYFEPDHLTLVIQDNYLLSLEQDDELARRSKELYVRQLRDGGHAWEDVDADLEMARRAFAAFEEDTGVRFESLISVCDYLSKILYVCNACNYVSQHVLRIPLNEAISFIVKEAKGELGESTVRNAIAFLTVDCQKLTMCGGEDLGYIPIGRTKDRPNRYEMKPIVLDGDAIIFSEVSIGLLSERWIHGILQRFLPYKYSIDKTYETVEKWKRNYEKALELDVAHACLDVGMLQSCVFSGLELHKHGKHPQELGDYDCLAYDARSNTLWAIECKELEKYEGAVDAMHFQRKLFGSKDRKGKLEKFERRIDYLQDNLCEVMKDLGIDYEGVPVIRPAVVSNKPFIDNSMRAKYEIMSFSEFQELLDAGLALPAGELDS